MLGLGACSDQVTAPGTQEQQAIARAVFAGEVTTFRVSVYYEDGAAPYDGTIGLSGNETWDITEKSYQELFQGLSGRTVAVPKAVSAMTLIADQGKTEWSGQDLTELGTGIHPDYRAGSGEVDLGLVFLNGTFEGKATVLGVHFRGQPFAFVFKDRVASVGGVPSQQRYVEQAVAVHELGHAVGLVNNGVPMASPHEDRDHPKHTTDENGVMYWAIETTTGVTDFVTDVLGTSDITLFGPESLDDAGNFRP